MREMEHAALRLMRDLDRCPHGRHWGDTCAGWNGPGMLDGGCHGGVSLGNPFLEPNQQIGFGMYPGDTIVAPERHEDWGDPEAWYRRPPNG